MMNTYPYPPTHTLLPNLNTLRYLVISLSGYTRCIYDTPLGYQDVSLWAKEEHAVKEASHEGGKRLVIWQVINKKKWCEAHKK